MPGPGFKNWAVGDRPSADDFDKYLQAQVVGLYADATARDAQITILTLGMRAVTLDNGIEWILVDDSPTTWAPYGFHKVWTNYTPTLTGSGGNPTMGTGAINFGRWSRRGTHATVGVHVAFGTGAAAGTGTYEIALPTPCPLDNDWFGSQELIIGHGTAIDASTGERKFVLARAVDADSFQLEADGLTTAVTHTGLIPWTDNDIVFTGVLNYECEAPA